MVSGGKAQVTAAVTKVNEALEPLGLEDRRRVLNAAYVLWVGTTGPGVGDSTAPGSPPPSEVFQAPAGAAPSARPGLSPADFFVQKNPHSDVERVACLAYYLTHYRRTPKFKTRDLEDLHGETRQPKISNMSMAGDNATKGKAQYLWFIRRNRGTRENEVLS